MRDATYQVVRTSGAVTKSAVPEVRYSDPEA